VGGAVVGYYGFYNSYLFLTKQENTEEEIFKHAK